MQSLATILTFKTPNFTVIVDAVEEDCPDLSWDDDGTVTEQINNGALLLFCARSRVIHLELGEIAADYLGNCVYESLEQFRNDPYCRDMVRAACSQARDNLRKMRDGLNGLTIRAA